MNVASAVMAVSSLALVGAVVNSLRIVSRLTAAYRHRLALLDDVMAANTRQIYSARTQDELAEAVADGRARLSSVYAVSLHDLTRKPWKPLSSYYPNREILLMVPGETETSEVAE